MTELHLCSSPGLLAADLAPLAELLGEPDIFRSAAMRAGWRLVEERPWASAVVLEIPDRDGFPLQLVACFDGGKSAFAWLMISAVTNDDDEGGLTMADAMIRFDEAYDAALDEVVSVLGAPTRRDQFTCLGRENKYACWEQSKGLVALNQAPGDLATGSEWETHITLFAWMPGDPYPRLPVTV